MDVISHALFGRMLGRLDTGRRLGRGSRAAFVLGALAPDVDLVRVVSGWDQYLHIDEAGTHTIAASPVVGLGVALAVRAFVKDARVGCLWLAAGLGALLGHVGFDLVSGSDMRVLAPFAAIRLGPHWLTMADLLAAGVLVAGTIWSLRQPRLAAISTFVALALLVGVKAQTQRWAMTSFAMAAGADPPRVMAGAPEAVTGSLFAWDLYEQDGDILRGWRVDARTGQRVKRVERRVDAEARRLADDVSAPVITTFLGLAHVPFPRTEQIGGRRYLLWSDLRHCDTVSCTQSFGTELGDGDVGVRQVIRLGPFEQSRAMPLVLSLDNPVR